MALGQWGAGVLRRLALLPARNQDDLAAVARRERLSSTDTGELIDLWRRTTDPEARTYLLEHPTDALQRARGRQQEVAEPRLSDQGRALLAAVTALSVASLRLDGALERASGHESAEGLALLVARQQEAQRRSRRAFEGLERWIQSQGGG